MLITKRGKKPYEYLKFKCPTCGTELIADAWDGDCIFRNGEPRTTCPVCGYFLWYGRHGKGRVSAEEYNKLKAQSTLISYDNQTEEEKPF